MFCSNIQKKAAQFFSLTITPCGIKHSLATQRRLGKSEVRESWGEGSGRSLEVPSKVVDSSLEEDEGQEGNGGEDSPPHPGVDRNSKHGSLGGRGIGGVGGGGGGV